MPAADVPAYAGRTDEGRRIVIELNDDRVVLVHAAVDFYDCETFGEVGPIRVHKHAGARVDSKGRFAFTAGDRAESVVVKGTIAGGRATGTLRVAGTIATGQQCRSHTLRFSARQR
jgi:hypothetical protein